MWKRCSHRKFKLGTVVNWLGFVRRLGSWLPIRAVLSSNPSRLDLVWICFKSGGIRITHLRANVAARFSMRCPKCQFDHELQTTECLKCGIVFSRYHAALEAATNPSSLAVPLVQAPALSPDAAFSLQDIDAPSDARKEFNYRLLALPLALLLARLIAGTSVRVAVGMLAMVLHESGHAITAWLTGRWAVPLLWVTMHGETRSWSVVLILMSAIVFGGFLAWKAQRWGWLCIAGAVLLLQLIFLSAPNPVALIVFGGDGGAMVLATILMATFYAPRDSALYKSWGLRWGLLTVGALTFMLVYRMWSGPYEDIPFGEIEGVNLSDPSLLTEVYGWSVKQLIDRYLHLAAVCFVALAALYAWGLVSTYLEMRSQGSPARH